MMGNNSIHLFLWIWLAAFSHFVQSYLQFEYPFTKHEHIQIPLRTCEGGNNGATFELTNLPTDRKVEFRLGKISPALPSKVNMELMTSNAHNRGIAGRIFDSIKGIIGPGEPQESESTKFLDVEKILFKPRESTMYIRVWAEYDGAARPDIGFQVYLGCIPESTLSLVAFTALLLVFFWLIFIPLLSHYMKPAVIDVDRPATPKSITKLTVSR